LTTGGLVLTPGNFMIRTRALTCRYPNGPGIVVMDGKFEVLADPSGLYYCMTDTVALK
jgi:hypothetical protein